MRRDHLWECNEVIGSFGGIKSHLSIVFIEGAILAWGDRCIYEKDESEIKDHARRMMYQT
jgi:hypothetical protein